MAGAIRLGEVDADDDGVGGVVDCAVAADSATPVVSASTVVDAAASKASEAAAAARAAVKVFNEDLRCQHGRLDPQKSVRRLIPAAAWELLARYFPDAEEFVEDADPCPTCANADREEQVG